MFNLNKKLVEIIIRTGDTDAISSALIAVSDELTYILGPSQATEAPSVSEYAPVANPLVIPAAATHDAPDAPVSACHDRREENYKEIYGEYGYLLLDDEDEIKEGDEWIIKPECETSRNRIWRGANDVGHKVGEFQRSHYRRII